MWDPPRPGLEPVSPALAGGFPTTAPPGKPQNTLFMLQFFFLFFAISDLFFLTLSPVGDGGNIEVERTHTNPGQTSGRPEAE